MKYKITIKVATVGSFFEPYVEHERYFHIDSNYLPDKIAKDIVRLIIESEIAEDTKENNQRSEI